MLAAGVAGCSDSPTAPTNFAMFSQTDLTVGTGGDAVTGRLLTVNYTGWFYGESRPDKKGPIFDYDRRWRSLPVHARAPAM